MSSIRYVNMTNLRYCIIKKLFIIFISTLVVHIHTTNCLVAKLSCKENEVEPFIKRLVHNATVQLPNPLPLQDYTNFIQLNDGNAWGLSTLTPQNSCSIICKDREVIIAAHLKVEELKGSYKWQRRMMTRKLDGTVNFKADEFMVFIEIKQLRQEHLLPELASCTVTKMRNVEVYLTGENFITWPKEKITGPAINAFKQTVHDTIKHTFSEALRNQLSGVVFSLQN
ncbi:uncharacterized protein LOC111627130 [Centruroides sculpturatus]|uniref:uncharacterized protein LOC111627130 n=1 Tax=Centruroides sculpturatus TaxID=218467 RepID=UPI000C6CAC92|nr:uncharacterized protein LOC111627130 [Centruroides sculpturatus]